MIIKAYFCAIMSILVLVLNRHFFINGIKGLIKFNLNMDTLIALGAGTAYIWSLIITIIYTINPNVLSFNIEENLYFESSIMIVTFVSIGKFLEEISKGKTTDALKKLKKLIPENVLIEKDGEEKLVSIDEVKVEDIIIIKPGDRIPVDGIVVQGMTSVDESTITGESIPIDKNVDSNVISGTINMHGYIKVKATSISSESTITKIINMIKNANATKAPIQRIADKIARVFVPIIICIAVIVFVIWMFVGAGIYEAIRFGITVLLVSCPCAFGLATPVAIMVATGVGAKNGVLFKNAESLETLSKIKSICMDKTGTITNGIPRVVDFVSYDDKLFNIAYNLEKQSKHPLAKSIIDYVNEKSIDINNEDVNSFVAKPGYGVEAIINDEKYIGGNLELLKEMFVVNDDIIDKMNSFSDKGYTPLAFANKDNVIGIIAVADTIRETSINAISDFKKMNLKTYMITGDNQKVADNISKSLNIDKVYAEVKPDEKGDIVKNIKNVQSVAMIGDGVNDAVALSNATVGIAIGSGSDIAIDSSDVILIKNDLKDVAFAIGLSKETISTIYINYFWALFYNILLIPIAAGLFSSLNIVMRPEYASIAMSISSIFVVINALFLNFIDKKKNFRIIRIIKSIGIVIFGLVGLIIVLFLSIFLFLCILFSIDTEFESAENKKIIAIEMENRDECIEEAKKWLRERYGDTVYSMIEIKSVEGFHDSDLWVDRYLPETIIKFSTPFKNNNFIWVDSITREIKGCDLNKDLLNDREFKGIYTNWLKERLNIHDDNISFKFTNDNYIDLKKITTYENLNENICNNIVNPIIDRIDVKNYEYNNDNDLMKYALAIINTINKNDQSLIKGKCRFSVTFTDDTKYSIIYKKGSNELEYFEQDYEHEVIKKYYNY